MILNEIEVNDRIEQIIKRLSKEQNKSEPEIVSYLLNIAINKVPRNDVEYMDYLEARLYDVKTLLNRYELIGNFEVVFEKLINRTVRKRYDLIKKQDK